MSPVVCYHPPRYLSTHPQVYTGVADTPGVADAGDDAGLGVPYEPGRHPVPALDIGAALGPNTVHVAAAHALHIGVHPVH